MRRAGVVEVLIGALDQAMMDACAREGVPCILIEGGEVTKALATRSAANVRSDPSKDVADTCHLPTLPPPYQIWQVRSDPALYPKMSVLKVGFYRELLSFGYNVWACDADAVFMNDPRAMMRSQPWCVQIAIAIAIRCSSSYSGHRAYTLFRRALADVAIATDCIDIPSDQRYPLLHCDFNTGLVYMRSNEQTIEFTERWRETIANAKETRIRDQARFSASVMRCCAMA